MFLSHDDKKISSINAEVSIDSSVNAISTHSPYSPEYFNVYNQAVVEFDKKHFLLLKKKLIKESDYYCRRHFFALEKTVFYNNQ